MYKELPRVVLVGRTNAGKSTLFNTFSASGKSLVSDIPGTTRDFSVAKIFWRQKQFFVIDTGGLDAGRLGEIEKYVQAKAYEAIAFADLILLIIDGRAETIAEDKKIIKHLKKLKKKIILVINKIDGDKIRRNISPDMYRLGVKNVEIISALNGIGTGDLLDKINSLLPTKNTITPPADIKISIIGKTNVGKSSLLNAILGEDRVIVTPLPHTTREPQNIEINFQGKNITLIDTAGLRKRSRISNRLEKFSAQKTLQTIKKSEISFFVVDVTQKISNQDQAIANFSQENHNGIILVANKWDLVPDKDPLTMQKYVEYYQHLFRNLWWAPIIFISALEKQRMAKLLRLAISIHQERNKIVPEKDLEILLNEIKPKKSKPSKGKKPVTVKGLKQTGTNPPAFSLYVNRPDLMHQAYVNLLEKKLRIKFGFTGTPVLISINESNKL
ncbi:MAG: ribosome biogenesis GTPase Der [Patescibacteria group bacterium]|jgi:GTP-binding protein